MKRPNGSSSSPEHGPAISLKPVLSLDTNYLSNLAKARLGEGLPTHVMDAWRELLNALTDAVWSDRLVCPGFNVQVEELEMDDRIAGPGWVVMRSLSLGLAFHSLDGILARQVEDVTLRYLGHPPVDEPAWKRVFQDDPNVPATEMSVRSSRKGITLGFSGKRAAGGGLRGSAGGICGGLPGHLMDAVAYGDAAEARLVLARLMVGERVRRALRGGQVMAGLAEVPTETDEWIALVSRLNAVGMGMTELMKFLSSSWLGHVPFVDLYCSLARTAAHLETTGRPNGPGDEADRCIVSALLPYCSLLTTDRFVKHLVTTELDLAAEYCCQVFSGKVEDVRLLSEVVQILPPVKL